MLRRRLRRIRQVVAERLWDAAHWVYPYAEFEHDSTDVRWWTLDLTIEATESEANKAFDRMIEAVCPDEEHHALTPCLEVVGGMRMAERFCECEDDDQRWEFHSRVDAPDVYRCSNCEMRVKNEESKDAA